MGRQKGWVARGGLEVMTGKEPELDRKAYGRLLQRTYADVIKNDAENERLLVNIEGLMARATESFRQKRTPCWSYCCVWFLTTSGDVTRFRRVRQGPGATCPVLDLAAALADWLGIKQRCLIGRNWNGHGQHLC